MEENFAIRFSPHETHRQTAAQFAARSFVANAAVQPGTNDVQFRFAHGPLETEQQTIVEQCRMIDTVVVSNQSVSQAAQFEKTIPIRIVARQTRDFKTKDDSYMAQRNFADHARETGALICSRSGETEVVINNDDLILLPAELTGSLRQRVLSRRGFTVVF